MFSNHRAISLIGQTARIVKRILRRRIEKIIADVLGGGQFGFGSGVEL